MNEQISNAALRNRNCLGAGRPSATEGLLCAVELVEDKASRRFFDPARKIGPQIAAAMLKRGVIARAMPQGDIIGFAPPLCLTRTEADTVVAAARDAIKEVAANPGR